MNDDQTYLVLDAGVLDAEADAEMVEEAPGRASTAAAIRRLRELSLLEAYIKPLKGPT